MYCVYCNIDHPDEVPFNEEHIIPQGIGGTRAWTIEVCEKSNSTLGNEVDRPFIESFFVNFDRVLYSLQSYRSASTLDLSGTAQVDGRETHVTYKVQDGEKLLKITRPETIKEATDGTETWKLTGDPSDVTRILVGKLAATEKKEGYLTDSLTNQRLSVEAIEGLVNDRAQALEPPMINAQFSFKGGDAVRFLCKMALAAGYKEFGETFGRSEIADSLRTELKRDDANLTNPGAFWPFVTREQLSLVDMFAMEDSHVIAFLHDETSAVLISLFAGKYFALVPLSAGRAFGDRSNQLVIRLDVKTKRFAKTSLDEYIFLNAVKGGKPPAA